MAKDLVRTRHSITKFYSLKSQLQGVSLRMQTLKSAQEACSVDKEADAPLRRVLNQTLSGYERRHELATVVPQPKAKLLKAQKKLAGH